MHIREKAYAKLNLFLDVLSKREDGFHDIKSLMHSVGLYDTVEVTVSEAERGQIRLEILGEYDLPCDSTNLVYRAAELFLDRQKLAWDIKITLDKHIPVAAGLGGGSSDAAALLRALNSLLDVPLDNGELTKLASELGSDVPYCLVGGTALACGRGEVLDMVDTDFNKHFVIAIADEQISAGKAYTELDKMYCDFTIGQDGAEAFQMALEFINTSGKSGALYNIFEDVVIPRFKGARDIKRHIKSLGASASLLCGSGPSVFGVFDEKAIADKAAAALKSSGYKAYSVSTVFSEYQAKGER